MKNILFTIEITVAVLLLIVGFVLPPMGVIDNSVLIATGIIGLIAVVPFIPQYIDSIKLSKEQAVIDFDDNKKLLEELDKLLKNQK